MGEYRGAVQQRDDFLVGGLVEIGVVGADRMERLWRREADDFVAFAAQWHSLSGQVFVFFVMVVAAAEAAVGLAIIIAVYRTRATLNVDKVDLLKL